MTECLIEEVKFGENEIRPVLFHFSAASVPESKAGKGPKSKLFQNKKGHKVVALASDKLLYKGKIKNKDDSNIFMVIRDRNTGKARLLAVDVATLNIWSREREIEDTHTTIIASQSEDVPDQNAFSKEFGSKKIKRLAEHREKMAKLNKDEHVKKNFEEAVANMEIDETATLIHVHQENDSLYRPPINRDASTPEDVYDLHKMVPEHILNTLDDYATQILDGDLETKSLCPFIKRHVEYLKSSSTLNRMNKCKILLYVNSLIHFVVQPIKNITKKYMPCEPSKEASFHILDNFSMTSKTGRTRPLSLKDKAICYIMVLAIIALDFQLDGEALCKDIKLGLKKLLEIGRILAFSTVPKSKTEMVLKIPLPPAVTGARGKQKRT